MDRFLHFVLLFAVLPFAIKGSDEEGVCGCAVFPAEGSESIIERFLQFNVACDSEGEERCRSLCVALAEGSKEQAPELVCEKMKGDVENLILSVFSKVCNETTWKYSGLKSTDSICCHEGKPKSCQGSSLTTLIDS